MHINPGSLDQVFCCFNSLNLKRIYYEVWLFIFKPFSEYSGDSINNPLERWRLPMLPSMRQLQRRNCQRWFMTTMHQARRTNGHWRRTEMRSQGFCKPFSTETPKVVSFGLVCWFFFPGKQCFCFDVYLVLKVFFFLFSFSWKICWVHPFTNCSLCSIFCYFFTSSLLLDLFTHNLSLFTENRFRPRILIDVSKIDMTTTVLGFKISMPIMIAPTAMQKMAHPEGTYLCPSQGRLKKKVHKRLPRIISCSLHLQNCLCNFAFKKWNLIQ